MSVPVPRTNGWRSAANWLLLGEATAALTRARLLSGTLSFKALAGRLGGLIPPNADAPAASLAPEQERTVFAIRWAVGKVAPWLPFKTLCLQQAIAARAMLRRRGIASVLHLGVGDPTGAKLEAHAWLDAGNVKVTGYPVDPMLAEVGRFV